MQGLPFVLQRNAYTFFPPHRGQAKQVMLMRVEKGLTYPSLIIQSCKYQPLSFIHDFLKYKLIQDGQVMARIPCWCEDINSHWPITPLILKYLFFTQCIFVLWLSSWEFWKLLFQPGHEDPSEWWAVTINCLSRKAEANVWDSKLFQGSRCERQYKYAVQRV